MYKVAMVMGALVGVGLVAAVRYFFDPAAEIAIFHTIDFWLGVACYVVAGWQLANSPDYWHRPMKERIRHPATWWMTLGGYLIIGKS